VLGSVGVGAAPGPARPILLSSAIAPLTPDSWQQIVVSSAIAPVTPIRGSGSS